MVDALAPATIPNLTHTNRQDPQHMVAADIRWAPSSEFVSSSIPSLQILTAHAHPFRGARDLAFCLKVPLDSLLVWASSGGSGETARMRRLAWTFAARIGDKYQIRLTRSRYEMSVPRLMHPKPSHLNWHDPQNLTAECTRQMLAVATPQLSRKITQMMMPNS